MSSPFSKLRIKNIIYDVKDAVARANIGNLSDLITVSKNTLVDAINEAARTGGTAGVTWISPNATSAQIEAAYQSGNVVGVINTGMVYYLTNRGGPTLHRFTSKYANTLYGLTCNNDAWSSDNRYVAGASIVPARPIGQASEGSSGSFARGDHVHDFSNEYKNALLECFRNVAWIDNDGLTYFNTLKRALGIGVLSSITANFTQGQTVVYPDTSLDSLKSMLTVTAYYSDSTSETLEDDDYTLSGTLSVGTSVVTVTYEDKTTTFNVTVTARPELSSISAVFTQGQTVVYDTDSLDSLKSMLVVTATYSDSSTAVIPGTDYTLSGTLTVGTSTITVSYGGETDTFTVIVTEAQPTALHSWDFTQSLTDSIGGITAVESHYDNSHPLTRTSEGLIYDYQGQCIDLGAVYDRGITIDIYVSDVSIVAYNGHVRLLMYGTSDGTGTGVLIFRQNAGWSAYIGSSWASVFTGLTSRSALDTVSESKITIEIADDGTVTLSINDVEIGSLNLKAPEKGSNHLYIGSTGAASSGGGFYNAKVKRVVIY